MKRLVALTLAGSLFVAGCGEPSVPELADLRDECNELGGVFEKRSMNTFTAEWTYHCNFDQSEES